MTFSEAVTLIHGAKTPQELFGSEPARRYRQLIKICHPDRILLRDSPNHAKAVLATAKLNELYAQLSNPVPVKKQKVGKWTVDSPLCKGDIADLHNVSWDTPAVLKVARAESDNDLLDREKATLQHLHKEAKTNNYIRYVPSLLDSLIVGDCRANVLSVAQDCYTLKQLKELIGPIEPRHIVWMMNRLLSLLGYIHRCGVVHSQLTPSHLLYRPQDHGLVVVGWGCSLRHDKAQNVPYMSKEWKALYPAEVHHGHYALPQTDILMAFRSIYWAGTMPKRFDDLYIYCASDTSPKSRPEDAWQIQERWKKLAEEEFGPKKFVEMHVPVS
jgi:serine/threonine protein kinase